MNLLDPIGLLGLSALVPVIALYFLKLKRQERVVPSTLLWKKVIDDMQVNAPFQRLKYSLLLLLQIFLVCLLGFALARPYLAGGGTTGKKTVLLIDTSASMSTKDGTSDGRLTRLQAAIRDAQGRAASLETGDEMAIVAFDRETRLICKFTSDRSVLQQTLEQLEKPEEIRDLETRGEDAFDTALNMIENKVGAEVIVLSDGCFTDVKLEKALAEEGVAGNTEDIEKKEGKKSVQDRLKAFRFVSYGSETSDNVGITQMDARTRSVRKKGEPGDELETQLFVQIENFSPKEREVIFSISTESVQFPPRTIVLKGRPARTETLDSTAPTGDTAEVARSVETIKLPSGTTGVVTARIVSPKDKFPVDDVASVVIADSETQKLLLVSKGNFFLERALGSIRGVKLELKQPDVFLKEYEQKGSAATDDYDCCVFENAAPVSWTDGGGLFIGVMPPVSGFTKAEKPIVWPEIIDWDSSHPLMRYVNFGNVTVGESEVWKVPKTVKFLVEGRGYDKDDYEKLTKEKDFKATAIDTPLVAAFESDRLRVIGISFDVFKTDWPYRPALPLFFRNAVPWLAQASPRRHVTAQRTGEPLAIQPGVGAGSVDIIKPNGEKEKVMLSREHTTLVKGTERVGLYQVSGIPGDSAPRQYAFNLSSRGESDNAARPKLKVADNSLSTERAAVQAKREIWKWIALAVALFLMAEWWVYHRRVGM